MGEVYRASLVVFPEGGHAQPLDRSEFNEEGAAFAPDGRFFAYASDASGRYEIYVRPFPNVEDGIWQVSRDGGTQPVWARDGSELFYLSPDGELMALSVQSGDDFSYGSPKFVIATPHAYLGPSTIGYDISPDGKRFLMLKDVEASVRELTVVLNWFSELERLAPTRHGEPRSAWDGLAHPGPQVVCEDLPFGHSLFAENPLPEPGALGR
jgi:Tol biopolymer transport system component